MTQNVPKIHRANRPHRPEEARRDRALDKDRVASMSDEGGAAAATMDLHEQLSHARALEQRPRRPRALLVWAAALGATAAGVLASMLLSRTRPRTA